MLTIIHTIAAISLVRSLMGPKPKLDSQKLLRSIVIIIAVAIIKIILAIIKETYKNYLVYLQIVDESWILLVNKNGAIVYKSLIKKNIFYIVLKMWLDAHGIVRGPTALNLGG